MGFYRVHVRASWYKALFPVSLCCVGFRCIGLAQKISTRCKRPNNTGSYAFFFFFIFVFFLALSYMYVLIPSARSLRFGCRIWKVNIDHN